ncbi:phage DNA packaging protein J [Nevskia sp.]|uniref:phage DNA packaging protein J n=1 Tax=Nevskia sp. TaxID=1929292 RepID=UPI003459E10B
MRRLRASGDHRHQPRARPARPQKLEGRATDRSVARLWFVYRALNGSRRTESRQELACRNAV